PIGAWVRRRPEAVHLIIGGRHLGASGDPPVQFMAAIDDREMARWEAKPGFFVHELDLAAGALAGDGLARFTIGSRAPDGRAISPPSAQVDLQEHGMLM